MHSTDNSQGAIPPHKGKRATTIGLSIVLPVYNEEESLRALHEEIRDILQEIDTNAEIIYVDDCSQDRSAEILQELARQQGVRVRVIHLRRNFGQTAALAAGFALARGQIIVSLDADGQNNPADIPRLIEELHKGFDVVSGWRRQRKDRILSRRLPSLAANWLISWLSGVSLHDYGCTLKAYRASLLREVRLYGDMHRFLPIYLARLGARISEIAVDHRPRKAGVSKYGSQRIPKVIVDLVLVRFMSRYYTRPMHFFGQLALIFGAAAVGTAGLMVMFKYGWLSAVGIDYQASFIETPLPALAATFVVGAISSLFFGILAEILIRIHHESQGIEPYAIDSIVDSQDDTGEDPCAE